MNTQVIQEIMVVEDEAILLQAITTKLQKNNIKTVSCVGGKQALEYLENLDHLPDAIWLDYYLKDMDGLGFAQELKKNEQWAKIPIIVVSNSASPDKVKNMLALGINKYILKAEYRLDDIVKLIEEMIVDAKRGGE
ncbi:MAG: response regulator [bacterium]|nr:response regulator [bacterium]